MMVLGDKEDRRNDRGGWREWAVGPDGIKFGSAGVFKWLRNDLVRCSSGRRRAFAPRRSPRASETYNQALFAS